MRMYHNYSLKQLKRIVKTMPVSDEREEVYYEIDRRERKGEK